MGVADSDLMATSTGYSNGSGSKQRPHVLIVPTPMMMGHTIPFMNLTKQLVSHGMSVTFVSSEKHIENLLRAKVTQGAEDMDTVQFVGLPDGPATFLDVFDEGKDEKMANMLSELLESVARKTKGQNSYQLNGEDSVLEAVGMPCCIISDMFGGWTHAVAKAFNIPSHVLFTSPAGCASMQLQVPNFIADGIVPLTTSSKKGPVRVPGLPPLSLYDLPKDLLFEESSSNYKWYTRHVLRLSEATHILVNTFFELEKTVFDAVQSEIFDSTMKEKKIMPIGPLLPVEHHVRPEDRHPAEKWLDTQKDSSVVYIAFGSYWICSPEQISVLTQGLEASAQHFVLVLTLPSSDSKVSFDQFAPGFEARTKERGIVVTDWVPQVRILNHRATRAFLTHCGWNSSLESIVAGVPMIAWPVWAEQQMNCRFLVDTAKLAVEIHKDEDGLVTKEEVEMVVRFLMQDPHSIDIHNRVRMMRGLAHQAISPEGSSQKNLEAFVKDIIASVQLKRANDRLS